MFVARAKTATIFAAVVAAAPGEIAESAPAWSCLTLTAAAEVTPRITLVDVRHDGGTRGL